MAVIFISPKQRQKMFFLGITIIFLLFLIVVFFGVFLSKPGAVPAALVFNKPKVNIDMKIFDSDQFKNLIPFTQMQIQYAYKAADKKNKEQIGFISAHSLEEARIMLENMDLIVSEIKEADIGRDNPFTPYYQIILTPPPGSKNVSKK